MDLRIPFILLLVLMPLAILGLVEAVPERLHEATTMALATLALGTTASALFMAWHTQVMPKFDDPDDSRRH